MMLKTQFIRYAAIGLATNAASYALYLFFTASGNSPTLVISVLYPLVMVFSFMANKSLTFEFQGQSFAALMRFLIAHLIGYLLNLALLTTFVNYFGFPHEIIQLAAIFIVAIVLFFLSRHFVFSNTFEEEQQP